MPPHRGVTSMTESNKVFFSSILITGIVVFLTTAGATNFLYHTAIDEQKERLLEVVKNRAKFIEVVHEMTSTHAHDVEQITHKGCSTELTDIFANLSDSVIPTDTSSNTNVPVLNFYIAEKKGAFLQYHAGTNQMLKKPTPYQNVVGKPMGMALEGRTGVLETKDHMGNSILCAFTNIQSLELGIVTKIFVKDLQRPFIRTALLTYTGAFALVFLSGLIMRKMVSPLVVKLEKQRIELAKQNVILHKQATTDALTQLYNRQHFNEYLEHEILRTKRYNNELSLIMIDIDHFKQINDTLGHLAGDTVLIEFSKLIKESIRESDILARWGGEEFVILIPQIDKDATLHFATKLCQTVVQHTFRINKRLTCSIGVTGYIPPETTNDFINRADKGLYLAKEKGRNQAIAI